MLGDPRLASAVSGLLPGDEIDAVLLAGPDVGPRWLRFALILVTILVVSGVSGGGSILVHALITGAAAGMVTLLLALVPGRVPARQGIEIGGRRYVAIGGSADVARQVFGPPPTGSMPPA